MNTPAQTADTTVEHKRICPLCEATCGLTITTKGAQIVSIKGNKDDVFSRGYICPKAVALKDVHEDPDLIRTPLIKRNGQFVSATWQEAFDEIDQRITPIIKQHGADSVALSFGNPNVHKMGLILYTARLVRALGSRSVFSASTLDQMPKHLSSGMMFGNWFSIPVPDIERTDFLLMLGANPMASNGSLWTVPDFRHKARALIERGGRMVVIDPRRSPTAQLGEHHFIRPGSDVFLLLGMVHTLFANNWIKPDRLSEHLNGIDELRQAISRFTPELVAARCGIPAQQIIELTSALAHSQRAVVYGRLGVCTQAYGTVCNWLIDCLNILTGNLDREGGAMFPLAPAFATNAVGKPGSGKGVSTGRYHSRVSQAPEVFSELPMSCLAEEISTPGSGQIKAFITSASNPVLSAPNGAGLSQALEQLEFMVSVDVYLNETTRHADVILPGRSALFDSHYDVAFSQLAYRNSARVSKAVFSPAPDSIPEWQVLTKLAAIVQGKGAHADPIAVDAAHFESETRKVAGQYADAIIQATAHLQGPERALEAALRTGPYGDLFGRNPAGLSLQKLLDTPDGIDLGALKPRLPDALRTPSGKIEIAPQLFVDDLQRAFNDLQQTTPRWTLIGRREVRSNNSWMHNAPTLAKGPALCTLLMHPDDAHSLSVQDQAWVVISHPTDPLRQLKVPVEITDTMMPGVVSLPHGFGHDLSGTQLNVAQQRPGANINALMDTQARDPLSGNAVLSGVEVQISPAL